MEGPSKTNVTIKVKFKGSKLATGSSKMPAAVVSVPFMRKLTALNRSMLDNSASSAYKKSKVTTPATGNPAASTSATSSSADAGDATGRGKRRKVTAADAAIPVAAPAPLPPLPTRAKDVPSAESTTHAQDQDGILPMPLSGGFDEMPPLPLPAPRVGGLCLPASYFPAATASRFYTSPWSRKQYNKNVESIDPGTMEIACDYDFWMWLEAQKLFAPFSYKTHDMSALALQDTGSAEVLARWAVPPLSSSAGVTASSSSSAAAASASVSASTSIAAESNNSGAVGVGAPCAPSSSAGSRSIVAAAPAYSAPFPPPAMAASVSWMHPNPNGHALQAAAMVSGRGFAPSYMSMPVQAPVTMPGCVPLQMVYGAPQPLNYPTQTGHVGYSQASYPQGLPTMPYGSSNNNINSYSGFNASSSSSGAGGMLPPLLFLQAQSRGVDDFVVGGSQGQGQGQGLLPTLWQSAHSGALPMRSIPPMMGIPPPPAISTAPAPGAGAGSAPGPVAAAEEPCELDERIAEMDEELRAQQLENNQRIADLRRGALQTLPVRRELEDYQKQGDRERGVLHRWRKNKAYVVPGSRNAAQSGGNTAANGANGTVGKIKHVHRKKHGGY